MKEVVVLGVGMHKFGRFPEKPVSQMGREAAFMALDDAGVDFKDVQAGFCSHVHQGMGTGLSVFGELGQNGAPVTNVEVGCSAGTRATILAAEAISRGVYDMCLVVGVEKMAGGLVGLQGAEKSYNELMGIMLFPVSVALAARRHMHLYGTTREQFAQVTVKAHKMARLNPYAHYQIPLTLEDVLNSRVIADPISLYECSPNSDGASAVLLCSKERARRYTSKPVYLVDWQCGTPVYTRGEPQLSEGATRQLAQALYDSSGLGPEDFDLVQLHDSFTPREVMLIEELGLCPEGGGGPFTMSGNTDLCGKIPVNTDGGLLSRGNPLGAVGGAMVAEIVWQLRGQAGQRQVRNAKVGLLQNSGYGGEDIMIMKV
ncbi:MAG: thiolase family protein [Chloroflexi bacterium]|nr:thiolase family protein [Chloroflexota bacterium]